MDKQRYQEEDVIDLLQLGRSLLKNKGNIARISGMCAAAACVYALLATPVYESDSLLRVKQSQGLGSSILSSLPMGNSMATKQLMSTYEEIIKSRTVVDKVIKTATEPDDEGEYVSYENFMLKVSTAPFKDTELLKISVRGESAEEAQKLNNTLVGTFLDRLTEMGQEQQRLTRKFLEERLAQSEADVNTAAGALAAFKKEGRFLDPDGEMKLAAERVGSIDQQIAENKVRLAAAQATMAAAEEQMNKAAAAIAESKTLDAMRGQLAQANAERISYLDKYTSKHPLMQQAEANIANIEAEMQAEIDKVIALETPSSNPLHQQLLGQLLNSQITMQVAQSNLAELQRLTEENQQRLDHISDSEQAYLQLLRQATIANEIHTMLVKRLEEAKVAEAAVVNDVQIVDTATLPEKPIAPEKRKIVLMALLFGMVASSGLVIAKELLDNTVKNRDDVEKKLQLPILGAVPNIATMGSQNAPEQENNSILAKIWRRVWKA